MKYSSLIDNVSSQAWGLSIQQAYLFEWIYSLPSWATPAIIDNHEFFFASKTKAIEELPLLTDKLDTMYRYYKQLEEKGLIEVRKVDGKDYLRLTEKAKLWGRKSGVSDLNPSKKSGFKSGKVPEINPTYKTTISDKITSSDEPNGSSPQTDIFGVKATQKKATAKKEKKQPDENFTSFKEIWFREYPLLAAGFNGASAKHLSDIIRSTRSILTLQNYVPSKENVDSIFEKVILYVKEKHHFCDGKPLTTWGSQYTSIVNEIINGKQKQQPAKNSQYDLRGFAEAIQRSEG